MNQNSSNNLNPEFNQKMEQEKAVSSINQDNQKKLYENFWVRSPEDFLN